MKVLSTVLISTGSILLALWALAQIHSEVGSTVALAQFASAAGSNPPHVISTGRLRIDTSLWSTSRIAEFKKLLGDDSEPPIAVVRIPRVSIEAPVFRGTDDITLNRGVGWIAGTAEPGSSGNAGIAGHRDGFFRALKDIHVDDAIEVRTRDGVQTYFVRATSVVPPSDVSVLAPSAEPTITLVTCYPFYFVGSAPQRFIVRAVRRTGPQSAPSSPTQKSDTHPSRVTDPMKQRQLNNEEEIRK